MCAQRWQVRRDSEAAEDPQQAPTADVPVDITNEMPSGQRIELYQTKATLFVTTRILVVDLLNEVMHARLKLASHAA